MEAGGVLQPWLSAMPSRQAQSVTDVNGGSEDAASKQIIRGDAQSRVKDVLVGHERGVSRQKEKLPTLIEHERIETKDAAIFRCVLVDECMGITKKSVPFCRVKTRRQNHNIKPCLSLLPAVFLPTWCSIHWSDTDAM